MLQNRVTSVERLPAMVASSNSIFPENSGSPTPKRSRTPARQDSTPTRRLTREPTPTRRDPTPTRRDPTPTRRNARDPTPTRRDPTPTRTEGRAGTNRSTPSTRRDPTPTRRDPTQTRRDPTPTRRHARDSTPTRRDSTPTRQNSRDPTPTRRDPTTTRTEGRAGTNRSSPLPRRDPTPTRRDPTPTRESSTPTRRDSTPTRRNARDPTPTRTEGRAGSNRSSPSTRRDPTPTRRDPTPTRRSSTPPRRDPTPTRRSSTPPRRDPTPSRREGRDPTPTRREGRDPTPTRRNPTPIRPTRDSTPTRNRSERNSSVRSPSPLRVITSSTPLSPPPMRSNLTPRNLTPSRDLNLRSPTPPRDLTSSRDLPSPRGRNPRSPSPLRAFTSPPPNLTSSRSNLAPNLTPNKNFTPRSATPPRSSSPLRVVAKHPQNSRTSPNYSAEVTSPTPNLLTRHPNILPALTPRLSATAERQARNRRQIQQLLESVLRSIADGNSSRLCKLLGRKSPGLQPEDLVHPLLEAVRLGQEKCVRDLLCARADPNGYLEDGKTPLYLLVEVGGAKPVILRHLLEAGADPNSRTGQQQWTPLHMAAKRGYQVCLKALITSGAWLEAPDHLGNTPLMVAANHGHATVVRTLLLEGAEKQAINASRETPLHLAARAGHTACMLELLENGAYPNARDKRGQTPLLLACKYQQPEATDILLSYKCEVNAQDTESGRTALHWAVDREDSQRVVELLSSNAQADIKDATWQTAFMLALAKGNKFIMELLLHAGCKVDVTDSHFNTALHLAAKDGREDLIPMLVEAGIHVDISGESGLTPLMLAAFGGHHQVVRLLLECGAQPDRKDRYRASALIYALISSAEDAFRHDVVKQLVRAKCDLNASCNLANLTRALNIHLGMNIEVEERLYYPIEIAFLRGQTVSFMMLLKSGADPHQFRCDELDSAVNELRHYPAELRSQWYLLRCLHQERTEVKSLKEICRRPVLQSIARKDFNLTLQERIDKLNVDEALKNFLTFSDLDEIEAQYKVTLRENKRRSGPGRLENIMEEPGRSQHALKRRTIAGYSRDSMDFDSSGSTNNYGTYPLRRSNSMRPRSAYEPGKLSSTSSTESLVRSRSVRGSTDSLSYGRPSSVRSSMESLSRQPLTRSRSMRMSSSSSSRSDVFSPPPSPLRRTGSLKFTKVQSRTDSGLRPNSVNSPTQIRKDSGVQSPTGSMSSRQKSSQGSYGSTSLLSSSPANRSQGYGSRSSLSSVSSSHNRSSVGSRSALSSTSSSGSTGSQPLRRAGSMRIGSPPTMRTDSPQSSLRRTSSLRLDPSGRFSRDKNIPSPVSTSSSRSSTPKSIPRCLSPTNDLSPIQPSRGQRPHLNGHSHFNASHNSHVSHVHNASHVQNGNGSPDIDGLVSPLKSILRHSTSSAFDDVNTNGNGHMNLNGTNSPLASDDDVFSVSPPLSSASEEVASHFNNRTSPPSVSIRPGSPSNGRHIHNNCDYPYQSRIPILSPKKEVQFNLDLNKNEKKKKSKLVDRIRNWRN